MLNSLCWNLPLRWLIAAARRVAIILFLGALLTACASDPYEAERTRTINSWIDDRASVLTVTLPPKTPPPVMVERESTSLEQAALWGVAGAAVPWVGMAMSGNPSVELGLFMTPIFAIGGAVYGAVMAEPRETKIPSAQVPGGEVLLDTAFRHRKFERALIARIVRTGNQTARHWQLLEPSGAAPPAELKIPTGAVVTIALQKFGFVRDKGATKLALTVEGKAYVAQDTRSQRLFWRDWAYGSAPHPLSDWTADKGGLFDRALDEATRPIAQEIVASFNGVARQKGAEK